MDRKGAFALILAVGIGLAFMLFLILSLAGQIKMFDIRQEIKEEVEKPSRAGIAFNSFLESSYENYPADNNKIKNIISMYIETGDNKFKNAIENQLIEMFPNKKVRLFIAGEEISNSVTSVTDKHETVQRKIALPEGDYKTIQMRFYE